MSKTLAALGASVLLCASPLVHAYLPGSVSGPFYNPQQSGHGINIDIVDDQRAIAIWHVYTTDGDPLTLYIEGNVEGRRIVGQAYAPQGMRFGEFNSADVELPHWGSVDIAFEDCGNATLSWVADDLAYGDGEMPIRRLVQPVGVECSLSTPSFLTPGLFEGSKYQGVFDQNGTLWAIERSYEPDGTPSSRIPTRASVPDSDFIPPRTLVVSTRHSQDHVVNIAEIRWLSSPWLHQSEVSNWSSANQALLQDWQTLTIRTTSDYAYLGNNQTSTNLVAGLTVATLGGRYRLPTLDGQGSVEISENGELCIREPVSGDNEPCLLSGSIAVSDPDLGLVAFRLRHASEERGSHTYFGRGWLADATYGRELVLVGHPDGGKGFGLVAIKQP